MTWLSAATHATAFFPLREVTHRPLLAYTAQVEVLRDRRPKPLQQFSPELYRKLLRSRLYCGRQLNPKLRIR